MDQQWIEERDAQIRKVLEKERLKKEEENRARNRKLYVKIGICLAIPIAIIIFGYINGFNKTIHFF